MPVSRKGSGVSLLGLRHEKGSDVSFLCQRHERVLKRHAYLTHNSRTASWVSQERPKMLTLHEYFIPKMHATPQTSLAALPAMLCRHDRQAVLEDEKHRLFLTSETDRLPASFLLKQSTIMDRLRQKNTFDAVTELNLSARLS